MDPTLKLLLCGIVAAFYGLFMAALISKYREVQKSSHLIEAKGRIVSSRAESRKIGRRIGSGRSAYTDTEIRNFAVVCYVFEANGKLWEGTRITVSDDPGNFQVEEKLRLYPVGATVSVYFDRDNPKDCVLHRDLSNSMFKVAIRAGSLIGFCGLILIFGSDGLTTFLGGVGIPSGPAVLAFFGVCIGIFGMALRQRGRATWRWPSTSGTVVASAVERLPPARMSHRFSRRAMFRSRTQYSYSVSGVTYRSNRTSLGSQRYATVGILLRGGETAYEPGQRVDVFYDARAPAQSVLTRGTPGESIIWIAAVTFICLAVYWYVA